MIIITRRKAGLEWYGWIVRRHMICYLTRGLWNARTCLVLQKLDGLIQKSMKQLPFALALIPLKPVLRRVKAGYNLGNGLPIINNLLFTDELKVYGKSENHVDTLLQSL